MQTFTVTWTIDIDAVSPEQAAADAYRNTMRREHAGPDDACVFVVTSPDGLTETEVDLSEHDVDALLALDEDEAEEQAIIARIAAATKETKR